MHQCGAETETRQCILQTATGLFKSEGWHETTTRGIAVGAGIATGTLFNYFLAKEAIGAELMGAGLRRARESFSAEDDANGSLEADLFGRRTNRQDRKIRSLCWISL